MRKVRSDKKRDVKPYISIEMKNCIYRLSYITNTPVQHVLENICERAVLSRKVIEILSVHFQRPVRLNNTIYFGDFDRPSIQKKEPGETERISTRFSQTTYENINTLRYALDVSHSRATAILLKTIVLHTDFIDIYVRHYLSLELDERRMAELKKVLRFINDNHASEERYSWFVFLSNFIDEIKDTANTVSDSIHTFLDKWKSL